MSCRNTQKQVTRVTLNRHQNSQRLSRLTVDASCVWHCHFWRFLLGGYAPGEGQKRLCQTLAKGDSCAPRLIPHAVATSGIEPCRCQSAYRRWSTRQTWRRDLSTDTEPCINVWTLNPQSGSVPAPQHPMSKGQFLAPCNPRPSNAAWRAVCLFGEAIRAKPRDESIISVARNNALSYLECRNGSLGCC